MTPAKIPLQNQNPYAVTTHEPSQANAQVALIQRGNQAKLCYFLACLSLPLLVIGTALAFYDIESIVGSGPTMLGFGVAFLILTRPSVLPHFRWLAWICLIFPAAIFLLIFSFSWSPKEAQTPVSIIIALVASATAIPLVATIVAHRKRAGYQDQRSILLESDEPPHSGDQDAGDQLPPLSAEAPNPFTTADELQQTQLDRSEPSSW